MSDPMDRDLNLTLGRWIQAVAPERAPSRLLEEAFARTMSTAQDRRVPWRVIRIGTGPTAGVGSRAWIAVIVALLVALTAVVLFAGFGPAPRPSSIPGTTPISVTPEAAIGVQGPRWMATDGTAPWLVTAEGLLIAIDPATNTIGESAPIGPAGDPYQSLAFGADAAWITDWDTSQIIRVDAATLQVTKTITTGSAHKGVLARADSIWVADTRGGAVLRIDPATNEVTTRVPVGQTGPAGPNWLADGFDSLWVDVPNNLTIARIDPATNSIEATIPDPVGFTVCGGFAIGSDVVWASGCSEVKRMLAINPTDNSLATIELTGYGNSPTIIDGELWVSLDRESSDNGQIVRIDRRTNRVDRVLAPDVTFGGGGNLVVAGGSVWASDSYNNRVLRLPLSAFGG